MILLTVICATYLPADRQTPRKRLAFSRRRWHRSAGSASRPASRSASAAATSAAYCSIGKLVIASCSRSLHPPGDPLPRDAVPSSQPCSLGSDHVQPQTMHVQAH